MLNSKSEKNSKNSPPKVFIRTFGCQMNQAETDYMKDFMNFLGFSFTDNPNNADIVFVNTCTVREHAQNRGISEIYKLKNWKEENPERILIMCGCVVENIGKEKLQKIFPFIDLFISSKETINLQNILFNFFKQNYKNFNDEINKIGFSETFNNSTEIYSKLTSQSAVTKLVPVIFGCNNFCSYCIVPFVRGREFSRHPEEIITEIKNLVSNGIKEITLIGQNVNSYKYQLIKDEKLKIVDFADLLQAVNKIDGLLRIRFLTNHPKDMDDKLIDIIARTNKICKHIHLPLQSGSDRILKLMNRKYNRKQYFELIDKIRNKIPEISITTDLMVGTPTETEMDFENTIDAVEKIQFDFSYVFKYSPRQGTKLYELNDDVDLETKKKRHKILLDLCNKISMDKNSSFINNEIEILVENIYNENSKYKIIGKTDNNRTVICTTDKPKLLGEIVKVKIIGKKIHSLIGEL